MPCASKPTTGFHQGHCAPRFDGVSPCPSTNCEPWIHVFGTCLMLKRHNPLFTCMVISRHHE
ncbi:MAG TPA: hypothetical protein DIW86_09310 [Pseudomonas sp.]|nr:hypothetical protein [Pseudomonas sp.]